MHQIISRIVLYWLNRGQDSIESYNAYIIDSMLLISILIMVWLNVIL